MAGLGVKVRLTVATAVAIALAGLGIIAASGAVLRSQLEAALLDAAVQDVEDAFETFSDFGGIDVAIGETIDDVALDVAAFDVFEVSYGIADGFLDPEALAPLAAKTAGGDEQIALALGWDTALLIPLSGSAATPVDASTLEGPVLPENVYYELAFDFGDFEDFDAPSFTNIDESEGRLVVEELEGLQVLLWLETTESDAIISRIQSLLLLAIPLLTLIGAALAWILATRALKPIRQMTGRVSEIDARDLSLRVPEPSASDEVADLARTMNRMLARVEESTLAQRQFVADASHELRSPVAILKHESELAQRYPERFKLSGLAELTNAEANRLGDMVDDLLVLAAAGSSAGGAATDSHTDLDEVVFAEAERPRPVPIDTAKVSAGRVPGRTDQLTRVVRHLLDNASRHATSQVAVEVTTYRGLVRLAVDDDGLGIAPADRERIFERFVRLDDARARDEGGAGLGLAVTQASLTESGGTVRVEDSPLGGARFVVTWPVDSDG